MEIYNNILCISSTEMIITETNPDGLLSRSMYDFLKNKKQINVIRKGCYTTPALIEYESLPERYRTQWERLNGDPRKQAVRDPLIDDLRADPVALKIFSSYTLSNGDKLPPDRIAQYTNEAIVIRAMKEAMSSSSAFIKACGGSIKVSWERVTEIIHSKEVQSKFPHSLPTNTQSLRRKVKKFEDEGYESLIHAAYCNDHSRKVSVLIEKLILSLYTMPNKPFGADVYSMYNLFVNGKIEVFDKSTGELYDRTMFSKNGQPIELSEKTVWGVINENSNRAIVDAKRNDSLYNKRVHRPHHFRNNPNCSMSKISMDDRDLPRKINNGQRVKAYYAYDVKSGCVIGRSYSRTKDDELFLECLRDMFRTFRLYSLPLPGEVEVEHHIVNHFAEELNFLFPIVRWCVAGNSQEKHAEHLNKAKKYGVERKRHTDIGRWWARSEAYITKSKREGADYVERGYDYDVLVADDIADINEYNNSLHPRQKKYPGMTRWQVLQHYINAELSQADDTLVYYCIGNKTTSTIRNNQYLKVQYGEYQLPTPQHISKLKPGNYTVDAHWLADSDGSIKEVYIYQDGKFIAKCPKIDHYNTAKIEWTEQDRATFSTQSGYVAQYDKMVKDGKHNKVERVDIIAAENMITVEQTERREVDVTPLENDSFESLLYASTAKKDAIANI